MEYLERNDFTDIIMLGARLLTVKDGAREVFVWVIDALDIPVKDVLVPMALVRRAQATGARIDAIVIHTTVGNAGKVVLKHLMNAVEMV